MTFYLWETTAANNNDADSTINWREGQAPSTVNNSARAMMAALAKYRDDVSGIILTGGSSTAYTATSEQGYLSNADGNVITLQMHATNGAAATLNVDSRGAKAIRHATSTALPSGALLAGGIHHFTFNLADDCWYVVSFVSEKILEATTKMLFVQTAAPTGWTKLVTQDNKALRIVSGTASTGGSVAFTTAFASQGVGGTVNAHTLTTNEMPGHRHFSWNADSGETSDIAFNTYPLYARLGGSDVRYQIQGTATDCTIGLTSLQGGGASHDHTFSGTAINMAVQYVDVIQASKD